MQASQSESVACYNNEGGVGWDLYMGSAIPFTATAIAFATLCQKHRQDKSAAPYLLSVQQVCVDLNLHGDHGNHI